MDNRTDKILSFLQEIEKYKIIERKMYCSNPDRVESDAEHSWHLAMFLILFRKELPSRLDLIKAVKISLSHDLSELYAGDAFAFDKEAQAGKKERELEAAKKLFSQLPEDLCEEFMGLFEEYEEAKTLEARVVKSFDKIQPIMQNLCSNGRSWKEHGVTFSDINEYKRRHMLHNGFVLSIYEKLLNEAVQRRLI